MSHSSPSTATKAALALSAAALLVSVGVTGGPALARALNADTVDHKNAVGAQASVAKRKGKLVATDKHTGQLPGNIIATAPNAAALDGLAGSAYLRTADVNEVVNAGGVPDTTPLPAAGVLTSTTAFTTTKPGRLLIDLTGSGQMQCPSSSFVHWWIQLDGAAVLSSRMQLGEAVTISFDYNGFPSIHLAGLTSSVVPAGGHTVSLAGGCATGANGGSATSGTPGLAVVTVIKGGATVAPRPRSGRGVDLQPSCVLGPDGRACRP